MGRVVALQKGVRRTCGRVRSRSRSHPTFAVLADRKSTRLNSSHSSISYSLFFFNDTAPTEISPLSLHDALPILSLFKKGFGGRADAYVHAQDLILHSRYW